MYDNNDVLDSLVHTMVVGQSANTYRNSKYVLDNGLLVETNFPSSKKRYVGGASNPLYPDIIIWKPNFPGASSGTAVIIEEIETNKTLYNKSDYWKKLGDTGITFFLVVPEGKANDVLNIIKQYGIRVDQIQTYTYNPTTKAYIFKNSGLV
ncbi:MAG: hypothetical protein HY344_03540 [Candidatus Levybacteria bacterium]|nr:hypothetical protein [Candidatus Levybacteria bacterium]